jgi:hypothetical protein
MVGILFKAHDPDPRVRRVSATKTGNSHHCFLCHVLTTFTSLLTLSPLVIRHTLLIRPRPFPTGRSIIGLSAINRRITL